MFLIVPIESFLWPILNGIFIPTYEVTFWKVAPAFVNDFILLVFYCVTFPYLMYLMNKLHKFEFERLKTNTSIFFVLNIVFVLINIVFNLIVDPKDIGTKTQCFKDEHF